MSKQIQSRLKELIRIRLSREWEGDQEAFLYHEAREWIKQGWYLEDEHFDALKSYQRKMLTEGSKANESIF